MAFLVAAMIILSMLDTIFAFAKTIPSFSLTNQKHAAVESNGTVYFENILI